MLVLAAALIAFAIIYNAKSKEKYHLKPRTSFAQVAVIGRTEDSETVQLTASLLDDESPEEWNRKIQWLYEERERRLKFQNDRILALHAEAEQKKKEAEAALSEAGIKLVPPQKS